MDKKTQEHIITAYVRPMATERRITVSVKSTPSGVVLSVEGGDKTKETFADALAQALGGMGYDVDVYIHDGNIVIDDKELED